MSRFDVAKNKLSEEELLSKKKIDQEKTVEIKETFEKDGVKQTMTYREFPESICTSENPAYYNMIIPDESLTLEDLDSGEKQLIDVLEDKSEQDDLVMISRMPLEAFAGLQRAAESYVRTPSGKMDAEKSRVTSKKPFNVESPLVPGHLMAYDMIRMLSEQAKQEGFTHVYGIEEVRRYFYRDGQKKVPGCSYLNLLGFKLGD